MHGNFSDALGAMQKRKAEAEMDAAAEDGVAESPACAETGAPPGATEEHKAGAEEEGEYLPQTSIHMPPLKGLWHHKGDFLDAVRIRLALTALISVHLCNVSFILLTTPGVCHWPDLQCQTDRHTCGCISKARGSRGFTCGCCLVADPEEARVDAIYQANGWHSFRQFLIFWGFLIMGMLTGILIWLVQRSHSK